MVQNQFAHCVISHSLIYMTFVNMKMSNIKVFGFDVMRLPAIRLSSRNMHIDFTWLLIMEMSHIFAHIVGKSSCTRTHFWPIWAAMKENLWSVVKNVANLLQWFALYRSIKQYVESQTRHFSALHVQKNLKRNVTWMTMRKCIANLIDIYVRPVVICTTQEGAYIITEKINILNKLIHSDTFMYVWDLI